MAYEAGDNVDHSSIIDDRSIGELAHDLTSPISTIAMWIKVFRKQSEGHVMDQGLDAIVRALEKQTAIAKKLLDYVEPVVPR